MGLTATEIATSTADAFDVELTFYAGPTYASLTLADYAEGVLPLLTSWTNVSHLVTTSGSLTYARSGSSLRWTASISGAGYQAAYFGPGQAILCIRRILVAGVETVAPGLFFLGQILSGSHEDDYRHGGTWQRNVGGLDSYLQRSTAPRITAGRVNLLSTAAVTASSTLATPAVEAGSGDFAGTLVNVAPDNTIDSNINTLWISQDAPRAVGETPVETAAGIVIDKVFFTPVTGYDPDLLWWIELYNAGQDIGDGAWYLRTSADKVIWFRIEPEYDLPHGARAIICASKAEFESYTGGAREVAWIIEAKSWGLCGFFSPYGATREAFVLDYDADAIEVRKQENAGQPGTVNESVAWSLNGDVPDGVSGWDGEAINISGLADGYGIRRIPSGNKTPGVPSSYLDGNGDPMFAFSSNLVPGENYAEDRPEWLLYTLEGQTAVLAADVSAGATTIELTGTTGFASYIGGFPIPAICESDEFTYTGRTVTTLTGVDGIGDHSAGAAVYPTQDGVALTGLPCRQIEILRKEGQSMIMNGRLYFKSTGLLTPRTPDDDDWLSDYDMPGLAVRDYVNSVIDGIRDQGFTLLDGYGYARYVQNMLLVIDDMSDAGRAKVNEMRLHLAQTQIDYSGLGDVDSLSSGALANYILAQAQTSATFSYDITSMRLIGEHATAIAPYPQVLDDLARVTLCCVDWSLDGNVDWALDMWCPGGFPSSQQTVKEILDARYLRDKVQYSGRKPNETYVRIHARTPDGKRQYQATFPLVGVTAANQGIEYTDMVCTSPSEVNLLAQTMYYKAGLHYSAGPQEARFTLRGVGEWLRPEQWVIILCDNATGVTGLSELGGVFYDAVSWLIESVTWEWGAQGPFRTWQATAQARRYWR